MKQSITQEQFKYKLFLDYIDKHVIGVGVFGISIDMSIVVNAATKLLVYGPVAFTVLSRLLFPDDKL